MRINIKTLLLALWLAMPPGEVAAHDFKGKGEHFYYDKVSRLIDGTMLEGQGFYEPSVVRQGDVLRVAMLEFEPGLGDRIVVGTLQAGKALADKSLVTPEAGQYRNPQLTVDGKGALWLSYEALKDGSWSVFISKAKARGVVEGGETRLSGEGLSAINHDVAAMPGGGLAVVWQGERGGQWDVKFRRVDSNGEAGDVLVLSYGNQRGDWRPVIASGSDGQLCVAWDAYDGESFSVKATRFDGEQWGPTFFVANTKAFEGRADVLFDSAGKLHVLWEEGGLNWGKEYRDHGSETNTVGPMHRFRLLRVAEIGAKNQVLALGLPLPSVEAAQARKKAIANRNELGLYYERGQFGLDGEGRLWVFYRHYYYPELALTQQPTHHIEEGWRLYARCLQNGKWSGLIGLEPNQRDGMQQLSLAPTGKGLAVVWTTGRSHRGKASEQRGVASALLEVKADDALASVAAVKEHGSKKAGRSAGGGKRDGRFKPERLGGIDYEVYMGDLHRHTDLSLCRVYFDGTLDDAYRYAIEAGELDFLGVTDHSRDISNGDVRSQLWWRSLKEVTRHKLKDVFFPMFAFERSHGETDHNVISLRDDMLRPYQPPLKNFWEEIDADTFTIPHNPIRAKRAFAFHDDEKRPLLEIYQGCRDQAMDKEAHLGLDKGYHMGFIASSDHVATRSSFACVWSPKREHEAIFRSMQARRTYGATAKIRLVFRTGDHWMGERVQTKEMPEFSFGIKAAAPIERVAVIQGGKVVKTLMPEEKDTTEFNKSFRLEGGLNGEQYVYIHLLQKNGDQAWSSPIWVEKN